MNFNIKHGLLEVVPYTDNNKKNISNVLVIIRIKNKISGLFILKAYN